MINKRKKLLNEKSFVFFSFIKYCKNLVVVLLLLRIQ